MASGKPEPPPPTDYRYDALPSTPQQNQYFVVLPFYSPSGHLRWRRLCRRYLSCASTILLLSVALYFLWPSDPYLKVVRNPDVYSLNYESLNVSVGYRGEQLGFVTSDDGKVKAFGTSYIDATLVLNGSEVISEAFSLIQDLVKGSIPFTTTPEIRGSLGIFFFQLPISAKLSCEVVMNINNQTIERQDCYPAVN
ncbi:unnamed protein product [Lactuca virosa]|uniref:Late embryogenesis abundant protein LEA-2 subgroup domain-containing protein n=1 Tax=Lactuca virosa TaxID=75947 RepID=A0AAU9MCI2_9ASTR|nr:unnamed protein product [Lactuca virosa]